MESLINVVEGAVIQEATRQLEQLPADNRISLAEVVAYTLNRIPPMYATTLRGWQAQQACIHTEMSFKISNTVHWAIVTIQANDRDQTRDRTPIPEPHLASPARSLHRLSQSLGQAYLQWSQVSRLTRKAIEEMTTIQTSYVSPAPTYTSQYASGANKALVTSIKGYLQRSHVKEQRGEQAKAWQKSEQPQVGQNVAANSEPQPQQIYMASARLAYLNVMEGIATAAANSLVKSVRSGLRAKIKVVDVVAYALNRLPTMYATREYGMRFLRHKIKTEMVELITETVRQAIVQVCSAPIRLIPPSPIAEIEHTQAEAIAALQKLLNRDDLTWQNVVSAVEDKLNRVPTNSNQDYYRRAGVA